MTLLKHTHGLAWKVIAVALWALLSPNTGFSASFLPSELYKTDPFRFLSTALDDLANKNRFAQGFLSRRSPWNKAPYWQLRTRRCRQHLRISRDYSVIEAAQSIGEEANALMVIPNRQAVCVGLWWTVCISTDLLIESHCGGIVCQNTICLKQSPLLTHLINNMKRAVHLRLSFLFLFSFSSFFVRMISYLCGKSTEAETESLTIICYGLHNQTMLNF